MTRRLEEKGSEVRYEKPVEGGRKRPDDVDVKWEVTFLSLPDGASYQRGTLPFFCHDVTPRELRVPCADANVVHPSGAQGVKSLTIYVTEDLVQELRKAYSAVTGVEEKSEGAFEVPSLYGDGTTTIYVKVPKDEGVTRGGLVLGELVLWGEGVGERKTLDVGNEGVGAIYLESR
ncbi:hypothetical protein BJ875DRAFT_454838 [Amylocarpus encephaloides]|uniref:Glyoxalase-like domain-containing protein n=1 Tax=Amylocarpus encephaloides TaxID=45428 RepID=A0A9P8C9F5_9HELO|nr:hypothetical protein BJ875DRAFT_454838 [Amylocarpus encephaloides]